MSKPILWIVIPCYNEESSLPVTLQALPQKIEGIDEIEVLIINDGSTDKTVDTAMANGVEHFVNAGLPKLLLQG